MAAIPLNKSRHIAHAKRCLTGLGAGALEYDSNRLLVVFYCLSILDLMSDDVRSQSKGDEYEEWREWIWAQQVEGEYGSGFRSSPNMASSASSSTSHYPTSPHLIATYSALLSLAILRDDFSNLDVEGLKSFLATAQQEDGSFTAISTASGDADVRTVYCAFAICTMLGEWSCIDVPKAISFVQQCRTYEGAYGQVPGDEGHGGSTFCALATLYLSPLPDQSRLSPDQRSETLRWFSHNQTSEGGFRGRTEKDADACYSFWSCAAAKILDCDDVVNTTENARFIKECEFMYGGIGKAPGELPDPYHTYLGLASLAVFPPSDMEALPLTNPILNGRSESVKWLLEKLSDRRQRDSLR